MNSKASNLSWSEESKHIEMLPAVLNRRKLWQGLMTGSKSSQEMKSDSKPSESKHRSTVDNKIPSHRVNIICEEAVRYSFVSHLSAALRREGISVSVFSGRFPDDDQIHGVEVSVLVISQKSASASPWFDRFRKILDPRRNNVHKVVPVLYGVNPPVMHPEDQVLTMLREAEHQSRLLFIGMSNMIRTDSDLVEEIVIDVCGKLSPRERIGIYSKLLDIENMLCEQPWEVRSLGIWGMPGIGKTTLAKALFNRMFSDYDASCFIEDFDEVVRKEGPNHLLEEKIGTVLKEKFGVSSSYITRLSLLRDKLHDIRILVILDDVRNPLAAESFLTRLDWLGPGSLIILTSRYKQVFALCQISQIYEVQGLNKHEALELFSQSAFGKDVTEQNEKELSLKVIDYVGGNPLALCIYGQELKGKTSDLEDAFLKLKQCPPKKIKDKLKSVYKELGDNEKNIFVDLSCFFNGENVDYVVHLLKGCGYFPRVGIDVLVEKCLVTVTGKTLQMNDMVQDVVREIIIGERIQMKKCNTLWQPSSIRCLLEHKADEEPEETPKCVMVPGDIKGICLDTSNLTFDVNPDAFKHMVTLRFLKICNSYSENVLGLNFPKGINSLPCELRLLHWENYPFKSLPKGFDLEELVELNMPYSQLKKLRARTKNLGMLKRIRLCHSRQLVKFTIHYYAQNIELIDLQGCTRLASFPNMAKLQHLRVLNLSGCSNIIVVPALPLNIEELYLQGTSIEEIPTSVMTRHSKVLPNSKELMNHQYVPGREHVNLESVTNLVTALPLNIEELYLQGTSIEEVPTSVMTRHSKVLPNSKELMNHQYVPGREHVNLESVTNLVNGSSYSQGIGKLVRLIMKDCFDLRSLPDMDGLESLVVLDLSGCSRLDKIKGLPRNLKELYLAETAIWELPELPRSLEILNAHDCALLESVRFDFKHLPIHYTFSNCFRLTSEATVKYLKKGLTRLVRSVREQNQEHTKTTGFSICIPVTYQISSFHWRAGSFARELLTPRKRKGLAGFDMSVVVSFQDDVHNDVGLGIRCLCTWETKTGHLVRIERVFKCWAPKEAPHVTADHVFVFYNAEIHPGAGEGMDQNMSFDELKFEFQTVSGENKPLDGSCTVTFCDVRVIVDSGRDTSFSVVSPSTVDLSICEEHPLSLPKSPKSESYSFPSSKPHNLSTVARKVKSNHVFSRLAGCVPWVRKIKEGNKLVETEVAETRKEVERKLELALKLSKNR